jgi:type VI secretion system protein ImpA
MPLREDILAPIAGNNPSGVDLRYDPSYEKIKEARREEDDVQMGVWQRERKVADWPLVQKLTSDCIAKRSKDLQLAAWLTEALINLEGFSGFAEGVSLMRSMIENFWDTLYPELEDDDTELRSVPLQFISVKCDAALRRVPLTPVGIDFAEYKTSITIPSEADVSADPKKRPARAAAEEDGKVTPEMVEDALKQTPATHLQELQQELLACREEVDALDELGNQRFGEYAPNFTQLKDTLDEIRNVARILTQRKAGATGAPTSSAPSTPARPQPSASSSDPFAALDAANDPFAALDAAVEAEPEPEPPPPAPSSDPFAALDAAAEEETPAPPAADPFAHLDEAEEEPEPEPEPSRPSRAAARGSFSSPEPQDLDDASARLASIARWLRKEDPRNPAPYLLLRGFRWGELRGGGADPEWFLLDAPPTEVRQNLKRLASEQNWEELLQESEDAMALSCGRAWLDLQRYTLTALKYLGDPYVRVEAAIRSALRTLLSEFPALTQRSLNDDTPAANPETVELFRREGLLEASPKSPLPPQPAAPPPNEDDAIAEAIRMRRFDQALQLVSSRLALESTGRGRFQRKSQLAQILVASGRQTVAFPILRELCADIEARHLEQWETSSLIVEPLVLLHRCLEKMEDTAEERNRIYTLVCRLDPLRAFELN